MSETLRAQKPYFIRALHEWMSDNGLTPQLLADTSVQGTDVPPGADEDGRIVLNVSWEATRGLVIGNEDVRFQARFGGVPHDVYLPMDAVLAVFARETREGMMFPEGGDSEAEDGAEAPKRGKPDLKIIK